MNEQNQQTANETSPINDLNVATDQSGEIKGGPIVLPWIAQSRGALALPDLEPKGEIKGGSNARIDKLPTNHNETVATNEQDEDQAGTTVFADLRINDEQQEQVKGGPGNTYYVGTANGGVWKTT